MLYGIFIYILGSLGCLLSSSIELLLISRLVQAFGAAAGSIVTQTVMRDIYNDDRRPHIFAKVSAVLAFSPAVGPLLGSIIAQYLGVNYVFVFLVLLGAFAFSSTYLGLRETIGKRENSLKMLSILKSMITDKLIWIYAGSIGVINGVIFSYYAEAPFIFINCLGLSTLEYGFLGLSVAIASFIGAILGKRLLRTYHYTTVMLMGYILMIIGSLIFLLIAYFASSNLISLLGFLVGIFLIMVGIGVALPSCLSNALLKYKSSLGVAGAFLGLMY